MIQAALFILSAFAFAMIQDRARNTRKAACLIGICSQALWIEETFRAHQWGMFALAWFYWGWYAYKLVTIPREIDSLPPLSYSEYRQNLPKS